MLFQLTGFAFSILIPIIIFILIIHVPTIREWVREKTGLEFDVEDYKGMMFFSAMANARRGLKMAYILTMIYCILQIFVYPAVSSIPMVGKVMGAMVSATPIEILISFKYVLMFGILPLAFNKQVTNASNTWSSITEQDGKFKKFFNNSLMLIGFLMVMVCQEAFYNIFSLIIALAMTITTIYIPSLSNWVKEYLNLNDDVVLTGAAYFGDIGDSSDDTNSDVQTSGTAFIVINIIFILWYLLSTAIFVRLPGINFINDKVSDLTTNDGNAFILNSYRLIVIFGFSMLMGKVWSSAWVKAQVAKWDHHEDVLKDNDSSYVRVSVTAEQKDLWKTDGFRMGYLMGLLLIRTITLFVPRKVRKMISKLRSKGTKMIKKMPGKVKLPKMKLPKMKLPTMKLPTMKLPTMKLPTSKF